nr:hypothetical protein CFP56_05877 [Quercus suber]
MPEKSSSLCPTNYPNTGSDTLSVRAGPLPRTRFGFRVRVPPNQIPPTEARGDYAEEGEESTGIGGAELERGRS